MPRTISCVHCGVVLNLPDQAVGRKLKCPKCGVKFLAGDAGVDATPANRSGKGNGNGHGTPPPDRTASAESTLELKRKNSSGDLPVLPMAEGDLRETFDLPSMTGAADSGLGSTPPGGSGLLAADGSGARPAVATGVRSSQTQTQRADALALFDDRPAASTRRKAGAEARAQARRCPTCGGVVPVGMSLCQTCGLDLETGTRIALDDDLAPPPPPRASVPLPITIVGGVCCALSAALTVFALVRWQQGMPGAQFFIPVAGFGVYAAVQFLRGKSVKLLLAALTLGAVIDVFAFIAMPIYKAQIETTVVHRDTPIDDPDAEAEMIRPVTEQLDTQQLSTGITLLCFYALVSIYLLSPQVQRHFRK
jgi:hypothetical protein